MWNLIFPESIIIVTSNHSMRFHSHGMVKNTSAPAQGTNRKRTHCHSTPKYKKIPCGIFTAYDTNINISQMDIRSYIRNSSGKMLAAIMRFDVIPATAIYDDDEGRLLGELPCDVPLRLQHEVCRCLCPRSEQ